MRRLELATSICDCMAALVSGDLQGSIPGDGSASPAEGLLPLFAAGESSAQHMPWLAEILVALLQRAQVLSLAQPTNPSALS